MLSTFSDLPILYITANGKHGSSAYFVENTTVNVTCIAVGARPSARLSYVLNGGFLHYSILSRTERMNISMLSYQLQPNGEEHITCVSIMSEANVKQTKELTIITYGKNC